MSTHFSRYPDDDGPEQAPCGIWIGDASDLSNDWSRVDCKRCLKWKDTIMATHEAEESAIVQQMGGMANYYAGQQVNRMTVQTDAVPEETPHIIVFDDADRPDEKFSGAGARPAALRRWQQISVSWNAHLFVRVDRNSRDDPYPCARLATPAELALAPENQRVVPAEPLLAKPHPFEAMRKRFSDIEDEVARGKHSAMSCFTAMRTAALYTEPNPAQVNRIPAGLYAELEALRTLRDATGVYLQGYMRDEIEDEESCSADQHDSACTVKLALDKARALEWKGGDK